MNGSHCGFQWCLVSVALFFVWWLVASTLLWLSWNRVICAMVKMKPAKLWQSLLLVATLAAFVLPCSLMKRHSESHCDESFQRGDGRFSKDCPYAHSRETAPESPKDSE